MKIDNHGGKSEMFTGDYTSWDEAKKTAIGYDNSVILEVTRASMRKVRDGIAEFERDSVLIDPPEWPWTQIACLLQASIAENGRLSVVDFGGSLGSSYYQCRKFLYNVKDLAWGVVEQSHYVDVGKSEFSGSVLRFYHNISEAVQAITPNFLLLSSVLPYLSNPYAILRNLLNLKIKHLLIDRTFFLMRPGERLTVQVVPDNVYPASYPAWFLDEGKIKEIISDYKYNLIAEFPALDNNQPEGERAYAKGFYFTLNE
jgi:hypothetical protein